MTERIVALWCPDWPVTAAGCAPEQPAAVLRAQRVVARTAAAAAAGVAIGQRRRQVQQCCPAIDLFEADPARDARVFEPIVRTVAELAPRVDLVEPGWLSVAARGPVRHFGGDHAFAAHLIELVTSLDLDGIDWGIETARRVGVGVADGHFAAGIAARLSVRREAPVIADPDGSPSFCAPLPIGWLTALGEADADLVELFVRLGLRTLGDLAALDPRDVLGRFGPAGHHARRLASGVDLRPANTIDPVPERLLARVLDDPIAQRDAVVFVAKQIADELAGALGVVGSVCTRLVVFMETENGERSERSWYRSAGLSAAAMVDRVRWQLDAWVNLDRGSRDEITGGIAKVRLTCEEIRADDGEQLGLWGGPSDADQRALRAMSRLTTLVSEQAVTVPVWRGGRLPTERYEWVPATLVDMDHRQQRTGSDARHGPWPGCLPSPSPAVVYPTPHPVDVLDANGRAVSVSGRQMVSAPPAMIRFGDRGASGEAAPGSGGAQCAVRAWAGPWPIDQHWWEPARHRRLARFQVIVDDEAGEAAHLIIAEHQRWFVIATYR